MGGHSSFYLAGAMAKTAFPRSPCSICLLLRAAGVKQEKYSRKERKQLVVLSVTLEAVCWHAACATDAFSFIVHG